MKQYNKKVRSGLVIVAILAIVLSISLLPIPKSNAVPAPPSSIPPDATFTLSYNGWDHVHYEVTAAGYVISIDLLINGAVASKIEIEEIHLEFRTYTGDFILNLFSFFTGDISVQVEQKYAIDETHWGYINFVSDKITIWSPLYLILIIVGSIVAVVSIALVYRSRHGVVRQLTKRVLSELEKLK